jgi:signal transduction histidine kinase
MKPSLPTSFKVNLGFAVAILILGVISVVAYQTTRSLIRASSELAASHATVERLLDIISDVADAESSRRGFVITRNEAYLEPYYAAAASLDAKIAALRKILPRDPVLDRDFNRLEEAIRNRMDHIRKSIGAATAIPEDMLVQTRMTPEGKRLMDIVRSTSRELRNEVERRREMVAKEAARQSAAAQVVIVLGLGAAVLVAMVSAVMINRDFSARVRAEGALREAHTQLAARTQELERSNADLEQFAYVASHDLQEPLRMVTSYLQLIDRSYTERLDTDGRKYIEIAVTGARRMQNLIQDLLAYSRIGASTSPLRATSVAESVERVLSDLRVVLEEAGAELDVGPLPKVLADPMQLEMVLRNLLANAVKFRSERKLLIGIHAACTGSTCTISISDNGIGIEPQYRERIFVIFQRLHRAGYEGTGIGLALCRRIVERHGGRIWVEPNPEGGSVFRFTLPLAEAT